MVFLGYRTGLALAEAYANADVFVFPSKTDTFGLVMIEAMACGVPVAAYPVVGPIDVVTDPKVGCLDDDLGRAVEVALKTGDPAACVAPCTTIHLGTLYRPVIGELSFRSNERVKILTTTGQPMTRIA